MSVIKEFFEEQNGPDNLMTTETYMAFGLVCLKLGVLDQCKDYLRGAFNTYQQLLGEFEFKTKEVG